MYQSIDIKILQRKMLIKNIAEFPIIENLYLFKENKSSYMWPHAQATVKLHMLYWQSTVSIRVRTTNNQM